MISIIIATHNRIEKLIRLLDSLTNQSYKEFEVIVVNDFNKKILLNEYEFNVKIIDNGNADLWWAESVNIGIRHSLKGKSNYILILNDDIIIDNNYLFEAVKFDESNEDIIQGPLVFDLTKKKELWSAGGYISWPFKGPFHNLNIDYNTDFTEVDWLPGMGTFFNKKILLDINLLNSNTHPQYLSDTDFTLSAKSLGFRILVNHKLKLYNETELTGGISNKKLQLSEIKNILFHKGSPELVNSRITFIKDHTNNIFEFIISLIFHYIKLLLFILKKIFF